jgi:O-antigen/teichoic acid export membrane protein
MGVIVVGQTIVVFAGNLFTLVAGLPFQIYVARVLGLNQLGHFGLAEAAIVTLSGFVGFGIAQTAVRFIPEYLAKGEHEQIRILALLATLALTVIGVALASCVISLSAPVMASFGIEPAEAKLMNVMALTAPIGLLTFLYQQILRGFQEIIIMIVSTSFVALMVKIVLAVIFFQVGWGGAGLRLGGRGWRSRGASGDDRGRDPPDLPPRPAGDGDNRAARPLGSLRLD